MEEETGKIRIQREIKFIRSKKALCASRSIGSTVRGKTAAFNVRRGVVKSGAYM